MKNIDYEVLKDSLKSTLKGLLLCVGIGLVLAVVGYILFVHPFVGLPLLLIGSLFFGTWEDYRARIKNKRQKEEIDKWWEEWRNN